MLALFGALGIAVSLDAGVPTVDQEIEEWLATNVDPDARSALLWISVLGSLPFAIAVSLTAAVASVRLGSRRNAMLMVGAVVLDVSVRALKMAFDVPRPDDPEPGFPSAHTARSVGVLGMAMFLWYDSWRARAHGRPPVPWWAITLWLIVGALTAAARVVGGVHWFSDAVGGFLLGIAFAMAANHFA